MQTPRAGSNPPLLFIDRSEDEVSYSPSSSAASTDTEESDSDSFEQSPRVMPRTVARQVVPETTLAVAVRDAINKEDLSALQKLLEDPAIVKSLDDGAPNAMDQALSLWLRDKQNPFIPKVVDLLKQSGAAPKTMKDDARYWFNETVREASRLVQAAKLLSFDFE